MINMDELIARLDQWLQANRPDYYATLQPGLSERELAVLEQTLKITLPDDFKAVYHWRNGQPTHEFSGLHYNYMWLGGDEVASDWQVLTELLEGGEFEEANWWNDQWVPWTHNGGGDHLCLDMAGAFGGQPGQVLRFWHDDGDRTIEAGSFRDWLALLVNGYESGTLTTDEDGSDVADEAAWAKLQQEWTPGYPKKAETGGSD